MKRFLILLLTASTIRRYLILLFAGIALFFLWTSEKETEVPPVERSDLEKTIENMQSAYTKIDNFKASFTKINHGLPLDTGAKTFTGNVYAKRPGLVRWVHYDPKNPKIKKHENVIKGETGSRYNNASNSVFNFCSKQYWFSSQFGFLMGNQPIIENFNVSFAADNSDATPKLRLVPKDEESVNYTEVILTLNPDSFLVEKVKSVSIYEAITEIELQNIELNQGVPDSVFELKPEFPRMINGKPVCPKPF